MTAPRNNWDWLYALTMPRLIALLLVLFVVICIVAAASVLAGERSKGVLFDCELLGRAIEGVATLRDIGVDVDKTVAAVRARNPAAPGPQLEALEREIRRMWREGLTPQDAGFSVYLRCQQQMGDMGRES